MTVSTTAVKITYLGNGSTTAWSFSFPAGPDPDIHVQVTVGGITSIITTNLQINVNPPIAPNPTSIGGNVVYPVTGTPLAVGDKITIFRDVPVIQSVSIANQSVIYPPVIERALDYLTMAVQEIEDIVSRAVLLPIDETGPLIFPPCPERANKFLGFDENCQPIAVGIINPVTTTNALRVPADEGIVPLPQRSLRPGTFITFDGAGEPFLVSSLPPNTPPLFFGARVTVTSVRTVLNTEKGFLFQLGGNAYYDLILGDPTTYDVDFSIAVVNVDVYQTGGRAKRIMLNGVIAPGGPLYPGQWAYIFRVGNTWIVNPRSERWRSTIQVTFFVDPVLGKDDGTADGLAAGNQAFKTINNAVKVAFNTLDNIGLTQGFQTTIQLAQATYTESVFVSQPLVGGFAITIRGAPDGTDPSPWRLNVSTAGVGIWVDLGASLSLRGISFAGTGTNARGVYVTNGSYLNMLNCTFLAFATNGIMIGALANSQIDARDISIIGNCSIAIQAMRSSVMRLSGALTVGNGLTWSLRFVDLVWTSMLLGGTSPGMSTDTTDYHLVGGVGCAGGKYFVGYNSMLSLGAGGAPNLPGSSSVVGVTPFQGTDSSMVLNG
jgi:hypothetical protein